MKIILEKEEAQELFYNAMCDGINILSKYGHQIQWNDEDYSEIRRQLLADDPKCDICFEDILMEMINEGKSILIGKGNELLNITLDLIYNNSNKIPYTTLINLIRGDYDSNDIDVYFQHILYGKMIY